MTNERIPTRPGFEHCVEMPDVVTAMRQVDGRLIVEMADGRTVDMTDWFSKEARPQ